MSRNVILVSVAFGAIAAVSSALWLVLFTNPAAFFTMCLVSWGLAASVAVIVAGVRWAMRAAAARRAGRDFPSARVRRRR